MQETIVEVTELRDMVERFGATDRETRYMIIERLVERIEIGLGHKIAIKFRISVWHYTGEAA